MTGQVLGDEMELHLPGGRPGWACRIPEVWRERTLDRYYLDDDM